jgi:hypothetical protein
MVDEFMAAEPYNMKPSNFSMMPDEPINPSFSYADEIQNEVNQVLAAAQLLIGIAKTENQFTDNKALELAETHIKTAIDQLRALHYSFSNSLTEVED